MKKVYVIECSWMWDTLHLTPAECRVYAYIYRLTRGAKGGYVGSIRGLAKTLGLDQSGVGKILERLMEKNHISCTNGLWQSVSLPTGQGEDSVLTTCEDSVLKSEDSVLKNEDSVLPPNNPLYNNINNKKNIGSVPRKRVNTTPQNVFLTKKFFEIDMETLSDIISRKDSMTVIWSLLNPAPEFHSLYNDFMRYWNRIERRKQLQIWYFLKRKIDTRQPLDPNPFEVLKNCRPYPINYNGSPAINTMIKSDTKMVKAYYNGAYGVYTQMDARLYDMARVTPLNYQP